MCRAMVSAFAVAPPQHEPEFRAMPAYPSRTMSRTVSAFFSVLIVSLLSRRW
jgi:hypothetical protein